MQVEPENFVRLSGPAEQVVDTLGPLAGLAGKWVGSKGWNLVALPAKGSNPGDTGDFTLLLQPYTETINFTPIGGPVRNRGGATDQFVTGLMYDLTVSDLNTNETLHVENGMWLYLDNVVNNDGSAGPKPPFSVARSAVIPHGDSALILGNTSQTSGPPSFSTLSAMPQNTGPDVSDGYTDPYMTIAIGTPFSASDINAVLASTIQGQTITETLTFELSSANQGGIDNIPYVAGHANVPHFQATFWLETVQQPGGNSFQQLQYSQLSFLDFHKPFGGTGLITWPHANVNTLVKV